MKQQLGKKRREPSMYMSQFDHFMACSTLRATSWCSRRFA
jgi:hypothetical protein